MFIKRLLGLPKETTISLVDRSRIARLPPEECRDSIEREQDRLDRKMDRIEYKHDLLMKRLYARGNILCNAYGTATDKLFGTG